MKRKRKSAAFRKRSAAARKGWVTRRARQKARQPQKEQEQQSAQMVIRFLNQADIPEADYGRLTTLVGRYHGTKGYNFDIKDGILKISISTNKTRKKFSVRR